MDKTLGYLKHLAHLLPPSPSSQQSTSGLKRPAAINDIDNGQQWSPKKHFDNVEDFNTFLENAFAEMNGWETRLAFNHDGSIYLERLVLAVNLSRREKATENAYLVQDDEWSVVGDPIIRAFAQKLLSHWFDLACHRYASHVAQSVILMLGRCSEKGTGDSHVIVALPSAQSLLGKIAVELFGNPCILEEHTDVISDGFKEGECDEHVVRFAQDTYASHVLRSLMDSLLAVGCNTLAQRILSTSSVSTVESLIFEAAPFMEHWILACNTTVPYADELFSQEEKFVKASHDRSASRVLEAHLKVSCKDSPSWHTMYTQHFRGRLNDLLRCPSGWHVLRRFVELCRSPIQIGMLLEELMSGRERELLSKKPAIFQALLKESLMDEKAAVTFCRLLSVTFQDENNSSYEGLIQAAPHLLSDLFSNIANIPLSFARSLIDGVGAMDAEKLLGMSKDVRLSYCMQAFFGASLRSSSSNGIPSEVIVNKRLRIIRRLKGKYGDMASDRNASFVLESMWKASDLKCREEILSELAKVHDKLKDYPCCRHVIKTCGLEDYMRSSTKWQAKQAAKATKERLFQDILAPN